MMVLKEDGEGMRETMDEISLKHSGFSMLSVLNMWINYVFLYYDN